ncbi:hypothetical protein C498_04475 [Haloferax volcanii DS2]|uniref:Uncharacterized protein n=1 Tax=Haloferax volcanii (strain ATCC 29605 / DSM 3757 / JCM 8879 / NBRC 14742 / NCIMB 2012 / VKM B-1768 / DS2) TaxID=309800 RepID=L9VDP1_HALVD|nr:hypothetical protein C498_04475 [Haloferax volcanii DS2]
MILFNQLWASIVEMLVCFFVSIKEVESSYFVSVLIMCREYALYVFVIVEICSISNCADSVHHKAG